MVLQKSRYEYSENGQRVLYLITSLLKFSDSTNIIEYKTQSPMSSLKKRKQNSNQQTKEVWSIYLVSPLHKNR